MLEELEAIRVNGTYELVAVPRGVKPLPSKWVYKVKYNADGSVERFKARLVVGGHRQIGGLDYHEVYAPVGKYDTLRVILSVAAALNWELESLDISNAFLNGVLDEPVYMAQPAGFAVRGATHCWELRKTLYGLKQAPREWFKVLAKGLETLGFKQSEHDQALWVLEAGDAAGRVIILHWVDDLLLASPTLKALVGVKASILATFKGRDLGAATSYLNMKIERDRATRSLKVSQPTHVASLLERFGLSEGRAREIPMQPNVDYGKMREGEVGCETIKFQEATGSLLYLSAVGRPDIATASSLLARHMSSPAKRHWYMVLQVLHYLVVTPDYGITYGGTAERGLLAWTDSDYAACKDTRRPRGGVRLHSSWRSCGLEQQAAVRCGYFYC